MCLTLFQRFRLGGEVELAEIEHTLSEVARHGP